MRHGPACPAPLWLTLPSSPQTHETSPCGAPPRRDGSLPRARRGVHDARRHASQPGPGLVRRASRRAGRGKWDT
eukprot:scaffold634044_cov44-Prasinocladus_malaysianus.AAC.3